MATVDLSDVWMQFRDTSLSTFVLSGESHVLALKKIASRDLQLTNPGGHSLDGLEVYIPDQLSLSDFSSVHITVTSPTPDSIVLFTAAPQGTLHLSLHGGGHRINPPKISRQEKSHLPPRTLDR